MPAPREYFERLCGELPALVKADEHYLSSYAGEVSDFARLNHNRVRQAGTVEQHNLSVELIQGKKHASASFNLGFNAADDRARLKALIEELRAVIGQLEEDPYLLYASDRRDTMQCSQHECPRSDDVLPEIVEQAKQLDLVGLWTNGEVYRGFHNSFGQRNWYQHASFHFDFSCFVDRDKATKCAIAGTRWSPETFGACMRKVRGELDALSRPAMTIRPGGYRVFLAPPALREVMKLVGWGGFGLKAHRTRQSSLLKLGLGESTLDRRVSIQENHAAGTTPGFSASGFVKKPAVDLVTEGRFSDFLVAPRSAQEFDLEVNDGTESPEALELAAGQLDCANVLERLGTGLYINDLWYLNYSERSDCRLTGMTRFACFWVEAGEIRAPVNVMRFDDSVYRMLGENLVELTTERTLMPNNASYGERALGGCYLPGALIEDFRLTL